ncbi:unnamed protein product [Paramecium primaurelia]|uniref:Uncharacterized protein n=1 Tax=Paramecium primaurelia TaxID=5886 RepID=A0A8S1LK52_PARPR|nr:unnamed protein product [Paramecium primaurelia]
MIKRLVTDHMTQKEMGLRLVFGFNQVTIFLAILSNLQWRILKWKKNWQMEYFVQRVILEKILIGVKIIIQLIEFSGGGYYEKGEDRVKVGRWIELQDGFKDYSQVILNGEYKNFKKELG